MSSLSRVMEADLKQAVAAEHDLVFAAKGGDREAFHKIYEAYRDRLYNLVFYSLGEPLMVEDVLQKVFVKIFRGLPAFRFESRFSTWVYRIAINECSNQKRTRLTGHVPLEEILGSEEELDDSMMLDQRHAATETQRILQQALAELAPNLRAVIVLKYHDGLSYDEIASILGCAPGTVASRLHRALGQMEKRLRPLRRLL